MSATDTVSELHAAARELAAEGVAVVPLHTVKDGKCSCNRDCPKPGKHPRTLHGKDDATTDAEQIDTWWSRWPDSNVGINTEMSGLVVPDIDPRHGGVETFAALEREHGPLPADTPRARSGGGGEHIYLAANGHRVKTGAGALGPGVDLTYLIVAPPSVHESGARYEWLVPFEKRVPAPAWVVERHDRGDRSGHKAAGPVADRIPHGQQHTELVRRAGSMRRWGASAAEIDAALQVMNKERLERPGEPAEITRIAESMMRYKPVDREVWAAAQTGELPALTPEDRPPGKRLFTVVTLDAGKARSVQYAMPNRFLVGYLNAIVGRGGSGKGTLASYLIAGWTRGTIPGAYFEDPVNVLLVGDEDDFDEMWTPRIGSVGGDLARVHGLDYTSGTPLNFERDIGELEAHVREHSARVLYADQILDHIADTRNTHTQADVRHALSPLRGLARRLRITVIYSQHPNKRSAGDLRDLSGGSGQLTDLPRAGTLIGYHPENPDLRVAAVGKLNVGAIPPPLVFSIEPAMFTNPVTGEVIGTSKVGVIEEDPSLTFESVSLGPVRPPSGPSKAELAIAILTEMGDDGQWHSRREAQTACLREDVGRATFEREFAELEKETESRGREVWWRLEGHDPGND